MEKQTKEGTVNIYTLGELVWSKIDGFPWWPSIILSLEYDNTKKNKSIPMWKVAFLGKRDSYHCLTYQRIKKWDKILAKKKGNGSRYSTELKRAAAYGSYINSGDLTYCQHSVYLNCLDDNVLDKGGRGVKLFKEFLNSKEITTNKEKTYTDAQTQTQAEHQRQAHTQAYTEEKKEVFNEEHTKDLSEMTNKMKDIIGLVTPGFLLNNFFMHNGLSQGGIQNEQLFQISLQQDTGFRNYVKYLCDMLKITYEGNEISLGLNENNNA